MKLKRATWKLHAEALRRYRNRHRGSLDRAEKEMDDILKPKIGRVSKTPIEKCVSADGVFDNTDAQALHNTMLEAEKCETKQLDVSEIKGNSPPRTVKALGIEKDDRSSDHYLSVSRTREHDTDAPIKISGNKELETSPELMTVTQRGGPSTDAVTAAGFHADAETSELESVYEEDESVFDDQLLFGDGFLDYETSSVSVDIFTDRVMSEELPTVDKPEEDASYCHDSAAVENEILEVVSVPVNSDNESTLSENAPHDTVKPTEEKFLEEKFSDVCNSNCSRSNLVECSRDTNSHNDLYVSEIAENMENLTPLQLDNTEVTKTDCVAVDKNLQQSQISGKSSISSCRSSQSANVSRYDNKDGNDHVSDSAKGTQNFHPRQPDEIEATDTGNTAADENLQQSQISGKSSPISSQRSSQSAKTSRHDNNDGNDHISDSTKGTQNFHPRQLDEIEATDTGDTAADENLQQSQLSRQSLPVSSQRSSESGVISRCDNEDDNEQISDSDQTTHPQPMQLDVVEAVNTGCMAEDENLEQEQMSGKSSSLSSQKASQSRITSRHDSVTLDRSASNNSSHNDVNWHRASVFQNTPEAATSVNNNATPGSRVLSARSSDRHAGSNLFQESASIDDSKEGKSDDLLRSPRSSSLSANSSVCRLRSGDYRDSAADDGEKVKHDIMASPVQQLGSSGSSSDWHLASMLYEESARDGECTGRRSTGRNSSSANSSKSSVNSSEWHIRTLLFENSDLSSRQLSGDLHARVLSAG